jgi:hypothetical protein
MASNWCLWTDRVRERVIRDVLTRGQPAIACPAVAIAKELRRGAKPNVVPSQTVVGCVGADCLIPGWGLAPVAPPTPFTIW